MTITNLVLALQIVTTNQVVVCKPNSFCIETRIEEKIEYKILGASPQDNPNKRLLLQTAYLAKEADKIYNGIDNAPDLIPIGGYHLDKDYKFQVDTLFCGVIFKNELKRAINEYKFFERDWRDKRLKEIRDFKEFARDVLRKEVIETDRKNKYETFNVGD
jgi:hypothetical protein